MRLGLEAVAPTPCEGEEDVAASFRIALAHYFMNEIVCSFHSIVRSVSSQRLLPSQAHLDILPFIGCADGTGVFVIPDGFRKKTVVAAGASGRQIETTEIAFQSNISREAPPLVHIEVALSIEMVIVAHASYDEFVVKGCVAHIGSQYLSSG